MYLLQNTSITEECMHKIRGYAIYPPPLKKSQNIYKQSMETIVCLINYHTSPGKARRMNTSQGRIGSIL